METVKDALKFGREELEAVSTTAALDARVLLAEQLQVSFHFLLLHRERCLSEEEKERYLMRIALRRRGMPIAYILGHKEFMGLSFKVTRDTLIPRPDTEILVEEALHQIDTRRHQDVLDLCCGSGAIGLSVAAHRQFTRVTLSDINREALLVSEENAKALNVNDRVTLVVSDLFEALRGTFDMILSNPPYIREEERGTLSPSVLDYEPHLALFAGEDGLEFYERIAKDAKAHLRPHGALLVEIGYNQALEVKEIMQRQGYQEIQVLKDLAGYPRVISCTLIPET